jgi:hypothetical protein
VWWLWFWFRYFLGYVRGILRIGFFRGVGVVDLGVFWGLALIFACPRRCAEKQFLCMLLVILRWVT